MRLIVPILPKIGDKTRLVMAHSPNIGRDKTRLVMAISPKEWRKGRLFAQRLPLSEQGEQEALCAEVSPLRTGEREALCAEGVYIPRVYRVYIPRWCTYPGCTGCIYQVVYTRDVQGVYITGGVYPGVYHGGYLPMYTSLLCPPWYTPGYTPHTHPGYTTVMTVLVSGSEQPSRCAEKRPWAQPGD